MFVYKECRLLTGSDSPILNPAVPGLQWCQNSDPWILALLGYSWGSTRECLFPSPWEIAASGNGSPQFCTHISAGTELRPVPGCPALEGDWDAEVEAAVFPAPLTNLSSSPSFPPSHPKWFYCWLVLLEHQPFCLLSLGLGWAQ